MAKAREAIDEWLLASGLATSGVQAWRRNTEAGKEIDDLSNVREFCFAGEVGSFLGILLVAGLILVPRLLNFVASFKNKEVLLITVVGLCLGVSLLAAKLDYSVALGAFLIGAIIAESRQLTKIEALIFPIRDLFSAVFFVSIGLLIDPELLGKYAGPIVIITVAVIVGKVVTCGLGTFVAGNDLRTSLRVGMGLAQIGEFSFIIAALGLSLQVTSDFIYPIAVAVSALTTLATPYLIRSSDRLVAGFDRIAPRPVVNFLEAYTLWIGRIVSITFKMILVTFQY